LVSDDAEFLRTEITASIKVKKILLETPTELMKIEALGVACRKCLSRGGKIIFAGNGGSFADSQHLAAEFISKLKTNRQPLPAVALGTNNSSVTAIGNDYGFEEIFSRELIAIGLKKDLFIPITTSGNSANILKSVETAKHMGIETVGLTGNNGGKMASMTQSIIVPSENVARIQECHILIGHIICGIAEQEFLS